MGYTEILGTEDDHIQIRRMTPAEHARTAEGLLGLVDSQFERFLEEVESCSETENLLRIATTQTMIANAQVHATLATAPSFYVEPKASEGEEQEAPDNAVQLDADDVDPDETDPELHDDDRPGRWL